MKTTECINWTEEELRKLRKLMRDRNLTYAQMSEKIGRTPSGIKHKMKELRKKEYVKGKM